MWVGLYCPSAAAEEIVTPPPPDPQLAPLYAEWQGAQLVIYVGFPGCLKLVGGSLLTTYLDCNKSTYTIGPPYLDYAYKPDGRTIVLYDAGGDLFRFPVPAHYSQYMPMFAMP
jgi:hypothetical protein